MMKKTMVAVALLMVSGVAFASEIDGHGTCASKGRLACTGRALKHYGYEKPKAVVTAMANYAWNGEHSGSMLAVNGDRVVRFAGLFGLIYYGLVPASSKVYAYVSAQVKALKARK